MRIVDRKTFLAMPPGTIFAKFNPHVFEDPGIKWQTSGEDFVCQSFFPSFEGSTGSEDQFAIEMAMADGVESPPVDYDCAGRDGFFERDQLFLVWSIDDARRLVARLQEAIETNIEALAPSERVGFHQIYEAEVAEGSAKLEMLFEAKVPRLERP